MKKVIILSFVLLIVFLNACDMAGPEERAIREMCKTLVVAIDENNEDLAFACIIDRVAFNTLNPSASARTDAESYIDDFLSELVHTFRYYAAKYKGKGIEFKKFLLGQQIYQYKGFSAFKNNQIIIDVDGAEEVIDVDVIVRIGDKWRIVEIARND
ncbi:hypothetical protein K9N50_06245 [bacterium]|nr:hypothetical protein [bacterium]